MQLSRLRSQRETEHGNHQQTTAGMKTSARFQKVFAALAILGCVFIPSQSSAELKEWVFQGTLSWSDGKPAQGVSIRLFDEDPADGKNADDDLTLAEGKTDSEGKFTVKYNYAAYEDGGKFGVFGEWFDDFNPYLLCRYQINGSPITRKLRLPDIILFTNRVSRAVLQLPDNGNWTPATARRQMTGFLPSKHGFKFRNSFAGYAINCDVKELEDFLEVRPSHGLCGGMSLMARQSYVSGQPIPTNNTPPVKGSRLYQTLYDRQMDSLGDGFSVMFRFLEWMSTAGDGISGTRAMTERELAKAMIELEQGRLPVLGLVVASLDNDKELWDNHQVLVYGYSEPSPSAIDIHIYDPNYPQHDSMVIRCERTTEGNDLGNGRLATRLGYRCQQQNGRGELVRKIRGAFQIGQSRN